MGHVSKTPAGNFRANWRNLTGKQESKTFTTEREANAYLAEMEVAKSRGTYVSPRAGKTKVGEYAQRWMQARSSQSTTSARDQSLMRTHVLPAWGSVPIGKIDHLAVQAWVKELSKRLAPASVAKCFQLMSGVMRSAIRDRLIALNPCDGVKLPPIRRKDCDDRLVTPEQIIGQLIPQIPQRYRALVGLAAGTGMRWGECVGLRWDAVEWNGWNEPCRKHTTPFCSVCLDDAEVRVRVVRVAVEVAGTVTSRPFPKSKAGRRQVPLAPYAAQLLAAHLKRHKPSATGEVFTNEANGPVRRTLFRSRVWRPALVHAGLLGSVEETAGKWRASWKDEQGHDWATEYASQREAVAQVVKMAANGLRFHDLRHSYATWLISSGVPVNDVQKVMGHEQASTTLNRYTHGSDQRETRVRKALADFC